MPYTIFKFCFIIVGEQNVVHISYISADVPCFLTFVVEFRQVKVSKILTCQITDGEPVLWRSVIAVYDLVEYVQ